jgi:hypothetical protein
MSASEKDALLPLSEQLNRLPESEIVQKVRQDYYRTGTYRLEDMLRILGDPRRAVGSCAREEVSATFCGFADKFTTT